MAFESSSSGGALSQEKKIDEYNSIMWVFIGAKLGCRLTIKSEFC